MKISFAKTGKRASPESRKKMSNARKGWICSNETRAKMSASAKVKVFSDSHRKNIGLKSKGRIASEETKSKMSVSRIGTKLSEETRKKQSIAKKGKNFGSKHYRWIQNRNNIKRGDRSFHDPIQKKWAIDIKNRDKWKCKMSSAECCGKLESHHIFSWSENPHLRFDINNGITLCKFHHPRKKADEKRMATFFQGLIQNK